MQVSRSSFDEMDPSVIDDIDIKSPVIKDEGEKTVFQKIGKIFKKAMEAISSTLKECYNAALKFIDDHPKLMSITKKIISIAALSFFFVYHPIYAPIVIIALGILFADDFEPAVKKHHAAKVDDFFNNLDEREKALVALGVEVGKT